VGAKKKKIGVPPFPQGEMFVVTARSDDGKLIGIAPLFLRTTGRVSQR